MATKLTNTQKAKIQEELAGDKPASTIAKEMGVPLSAVKNYLSELFTSMAKVREISKKAAKDAAPKTIGDLMIKETSGQKKSGVSIMTQTAAERSDTFKEEVRAKGGAEFLNRYQDSLHKINPTKKTY